MHVGMLSGSIPSLSVCSAGQKAHLDKSREQYAPTNGFLLSWKAPILMFTAYCWDGPESASKLCCIKCRAS